MPVDGTRSEVVLAGEGGQGVVVAGVLLGEAAVEEGLEAVQSQWVFGSATRGSLSRSEVVVSRERIAYPRVRRAGVLLALTTPALRRHAGLVGPGALVITDSENVQDPTLLVSGARVHRLPIVRSAQERGLGRSVNVVALGTVVALSGLVRSESVRRVLRRRFGARAEPNLQAFELGLALGSTWQEGGAGSP